MKYKFHDWSMPEDTADDFWQTLKSFLIIYQVLFQHYISKHKIIYHLVPIQGIKLQLYIVNSLTTEKQTTKFSSANFQKMLSPSYIILRIQRLGGKQCESR